MESEQIRNFLRSRNHILVHFSTIMSVRSHFFPNDILNAITLKDIALSFSTVTLGDTGPHAKPGGAEGEIGLLVDIGSSTEVLAVGPDDIGSSDFGSLGAPPTINALAESIDKRQPSNEWLIKNYQPKALFVFPNIHVRHPAGGEIPITLESALSHFPELRVISATKDTFLEFNRSTETWTAITYDQIFS
jgi:hypothetical protein